MSRHEKTCDHLVQFYVNTASLTETVSSFVREGLRDGGAVVVIGTPEHREAFAAAMGPEELASAGKRLIQLDAAATLDCFMAPEGPVWERFQDAIGPVLSLAAREAREGRVRAFGEMVDLLWQRGDLSAAVRLEQFWGRLLEGMGVPLFCAYKADVLDGAIGAELDAMVDTHSHLVPTHAALGSAVDRALETALGTEKAAALRPLIAANQCRGARLPWPENVLFWLRRNLPEHAERVLSLTRANLLELTAAT